MLLLVLVTLELFAVFFVIRKVEKNLPAVSDLPKYINIYRTALYRLRSPQKRVDYDIIWQYLTSSNIIQQYSTIVYNIWHRSTIFGIILHYSALFDNIRHVSNIRYHSVRFDILSTIFLISRHYSTQFDIFRHSNDVENVKQCRCLQFFSVE